MHTVIEKKPTDATPGKAVGTCYFKVQMQISKIPGYQLVKWPINWGPSQKISFKDLIFDLLRPNSQPSLLDTVNMRFEVHFVLVLSTKFYKARGRNWYFLSHYSTAYSILNSVDL